MSGISFITFVTTIIIIIITIITIFLITTTIIPILIIIITTIIPILIIIITTIIPIIISIIIDRSGTIQINSIQINLILHCFDMWFRLLIKEDIIEALITLKQSSRFMRSFIKSTLIYSLKNFKINSINIIHLMRYYF